MSDDHGPDAYASQYEQTFERALSNLGLTGPNFDFFWRHVEAERAAYPWDYSREIPGTDGIRVFATREAFQDLPALLIYYRVEHGPNTIVYVSISPNWDDTDIPDL